MRIILAPAKNMQLVEDSPYELSKPQFLAKTQILLDKLKFAPSRVSILPHPLGIMRRARSVTTYKKAGGFFSLRRGIFCCNRGRFPVK